MDDSPAAPPCSRPTTARALAIVLAVLGMTACVGSQPLGTPGATTRAYRLPFAAGTRRFCVQGADGPFSHQGRQRHAYDFAMPVGTPVHAARAGRVVAVKEDSNRGGGSRANSEHGNYVKVLHDDGSRAVYLHLMQHGADVAVGDLVHRGQPIARSGDTGWSSMPHLHVHVEVREEDGHWTSIPMSFEDVRGDGVPRMLMWYTSANARPVPPTTR